MITPEAAMARAVELSYGGYPAPNPHVGCVLINDNQIVGRGFHDHAGGPHAEIVALFEAGLRARGATAYVTLEPCNHHGRTGPCSLALIDAGVKEVVVAVSDPNPAAAGGRSTLENAGVKYSEGLMGEEAKEANRWWLESQRLHRPYIVGKVAMSLDGNIATASGESKWITGPEAREAGHRLRAQAGAVLIGKGTALIDNPELTSRIPEVVNQPTRIVLDRHGELPKTLHIFDEEAPTLQIVEVAKLPEQLSASASEQGFDLASLLDKLFSLGHTSLLIEGGPSTLAKFLEAKLVDELHLFVAPKLISGGKSWLKSVPVSQLPQVADWHFHRLKMVGQDAELVLRPIVPEA